jgi:hypothetical protein
MEFWSRNVEESDPSERPRRRWKNDIKIDLRVVRYERKYLN